MFSTITERVGRFEFEDIIRQARICEYIDRMKIVKIVVEKHSDGYVAYPLGLKGAVVGEGDTYDEALADCQSAVRFHVKTFGPEVLDAESPVLEAFIAEAHA